MARETPTFDFAPYRLSGVVVGALLNHAAALEALGDVVDAGPYKAAPKGPILFVKPRNTLSGSGGETALPPTADALQIGASLGIVIGRTACRVAVEHAPQHVAGYTLVADISVPHDSYYRPAIRCKALDASCLIGPRIAARREVADPDRLAIEVSIDGAVAHCATTSGMIRPAARLLADVSEFMTLRPGDLLLLGVALGAPSARAGQRYSIQAEPIGRLEGRIAPPAAKGAA